MNLELVIFTNRKMHKHLVYILLFSLALGSCKRQKCLKSTGKESSIRVDLPDFKTLEIQEKLVPTIVIDTVNYAIVTGGENVIPFISFDNPTDELIVYNRNRCNYLRSLKRKIKVEIHCKPFTKIMWRGSEPMNFVGTLNTDKLHIQIDDTVNDLEMDISTNECIVALPVGSANFKLSGSTNKLFINVASNGSGNTANLDVSEIIHVENYSPGGITLKANCDSLVSIIHSSGNISYYGQPNHISTINNGSGELIDLD